MERVKLKLTLPDSVSAKLQGMVSRGIAALEVDENGHLIVTLTDNTVHDLGKVSGEDGVSVTHEWDGTVLRVTSASGTSEADLKGERGNDGYTPVKGKDYFDGYTPQKGVDYFDGYTPVKGEDYFDGKDGEDGYTPRKGVDYFDGKDGVSASHSWDGTKLTITSASGTSSADLKGEKGNVGYTPVKGKDYFDGVSVTHEWDGTKLKVTSASGTSEADLKGERGDDGYTPQKDVDYFDGYTPVKGKDYFDGYTPQKNVDYFDGKDGVSASHSWNGSVLIMTSASGTSSADLRGPEGAKGDPGAGLVISGSVATYADLPQNLTLADAGEAYFVEADGKLYIWSGTAWPANGEGSQFKGDKGDPGKDGYTPVKGVDYFDGEDGYTPVKGKDYFDGKDGTSATHRWNGTVLEITSASGTTSADLKGATGDAGYTPQKGVDYFDGEDGYTPVKGVDYFDGIDGVDGKDGYTPVKNKDYFDGKDGEDGYTPQKGVDYFDGEDGKSAYESAQDGGYTGTESAFNSALSEVPTHVTDSVKHITADERKAWNAKSNFSGSYNDLTNKPTIPTVPTKVSAFENDAKYLTSYTETDPNVPAWAKAASKPSYTASEVGAAPSSHVSDTTVHITADERTAWNAKQAALKFDTTPTAGSTNPVTSGGIKTALNGKQAAGSYAAASHTHTKSQITDFPATMTPAAHKASHMTGGSDAMSPADIGAAEAAHTHDDRYYTETETDTKLAAKAPAYTYGTTDLSAGSSALATGTLYFVYE